MSKDYFTTLTLKVSLNKKDILTPAYLSGLVLGFDVETNAENLHSPHCTGNRK